MLWQWLFRFNFPFIIFYLLTLSQRIISSFFHLSLFKMYFLFVKHNLLFIHPPPYFLFSYAHSFQNILRYNCSSPSTNQSAFNVTHHNNSIYQFLCKYLCMLHISETCAIFIISYTFYMQSFCFQQCRRRVQW